MLVTGEGREGAVTLWHAKMIVPCGTIMLSTFPMAMFCKALNLLVQLVFASSPLGSLELMFTDSTNFA
jgi:hypothetical protein